MQRLHDLLKAAALGTIPIVGGFLALLLWQMSSTVASVRKDEGRIAISAEAALDAINRPCGMGKPCGTLADITESIKRSSDVQTQYGQIAREITRPCSNRKDVPTHCGTLSTVNLAIASLAQTEDAATKTIKGVDTAMDTVSGSAAQLTQAALPAIARTNDVLGATNIAVGHLDAILASPDIVNSIKNTNQTMGHINAVTGDLQTEADKFTHPTKKTGFWAGVDATFLWIHSHVLPPIF